MSTPKRALLWIMAVFYVLAGVNHFIKPGFYLPMMPDYLPGHMALIYASGVAEVALGVALLMPRLRALAAWGVIALLVAVFPANLYVAMNEIPLIGPDPVWNWVRLPFQGLFIAWAWWYTRPDAPRRVARAGAPAAHGVAGVSVGAEDSGSTTTPVGSEPSQPSAPGRCQA